MLHEEQVYTGTDFLSISSGMLRRRVKEDTPKAQPRTIEFTVKDEKTGKPKKDETGKIIKETKTIYELVYDKVDGFITDLSFRDTPFGKNLDISICGETISLGTKSKYFTDFARKLPNINLKKEVELNPFDFIPEGKRHIGISITQNDKKIKNYFYDGKDNLHGMPKPESKDMQSDDWEIYFIQVKQFLVKYIEDMPKEYSSDLNLEEDNCDSDNYDHSMDRTQVSNPLPSEDNNWHVPEIKHEERMKPEDLPF